MTQVFYAFLLTSALGTAFALIIAILRPLTRKVFSAGWHYYIWLAVLVVMILPVRLNLPEKFIPSHVGTQTIAIESDEVQNTQITQTVQTQIQIPKKQLIQKDVSDVITPIKSFMCDNALLISYIWLLVSVVLFIVKIIRYIIFLNIMKEHSEPVLCVDINAYTSKNITTRASSTINSPLVIGIFRPTLLLPKTDITREQLNNILAHEITHLKRNDILYKWFVSIVKCVHWFNPAIYFISRQINSDCEISCDLSVVKNMDINNKKKYAETILSLLSHNNSKAVPLTTGMTGDKTLLKKRFIMIKEKQITNKFAHIISIILSVLFLSATVFSGGVLANDIFNAKNNENYLNIEVLHNNHLVKLTNKPFYKDDILYLPLKELLEKTGLLSHNNCRLEWNNGKITIYIAEGDNIPQYDSNTNITGNEPAVLNYCYEIEIGKAEFIINPEGSPMHTSNNPLYKEHLNKKVKMQYAPVLKNDVTYIPYEYVDYMINSFTQNNEITFQNNTDSVSKNSIKNAENMTLEDIRSLQISVDSGHFPWRLDPKQVIMAFLSGKGMDVKNIRVPEYSGDKLKYTDGNMVIELFKPIDKSPNGIWIVKSYTENQNNGLIWPTESTQIVRGFETRVHPITGEKKVHTGIDIKATEGTVVFSSISGTVKDTGYDTEYGNFVLIENDTISVYYGHLSDIDVNKGDYVKQKSIVGKAGKTGTATGSFLHFEIKINGAYCDPLEIFKEYKASENIKPDSLRIKSTEKSNELYAGFEHLTLKNATINKLEQELNKKGINKTKNSAVDLAKNYVVKDYNTENTLVKADENGNITIYFLSESDNLFDVNFYDAQTGENVAGYNVLANNENAYTFIGFEQKKSYNVEVVSKTKNSWVIEGKYIIY